MSFKKLTGVVLSVIIGTGFACLAGCSNPEYTSTGANTSLSSSALGFTSGDLDDGATDASGSSSSASSSSGSSSGNSSSTTADNVTTNTEVSYDGYTITLSDSGITTNSSYVTISGSTATITAAGTYTVTGTLSDGYICVDTDSGEVQLALNGASITCSSSAAIYVKNADKTYISLASGSTNYVAVTGDYVAIDDNNIDGAIFAKDDLTINGSGSLTINADYGHGIVGKDDVVIAAATLNITAASHAIQGKDCVKIASGTFDFTCGKDGIHAENSDDATLGYIYIAGGTFTIAADGDGMDAGYILQIDDGTFDITTYGGYKYYSSSDTTSRKGIKSAEDMYIAGGAFTLNTCDDSIHSNEAIQVTGGSFTIKTGDDAFHADDTLELDGADIDIEYCYEGLEGYIVTVTSGDISIYATDDGINAAGGDGSAAGNNGGMTDNFASASSGAYIQIDGGMLAIQAAGDGIDSNGNIYVNGGEIYVCGCTNGEDSAIDGDGTITITGGTVVAVNSYSQLEETFGSSSTQCVLNVLISTSSTTSGTVSLANSSGTTVLSYTPATAYAYIVISGGDLSKGMSYTLTYGSKTYSGTLNSSSYITSVTISSSGSSGGGSTPGGSTPGGFGR